MARKVDEWIGKTDDTRVPDRVKLRVFEKQDGCCAITGHKFSVGDKKELDHIIALVNGGENRESNLQWIMPDPHKEKTKKDVAQKARTNRIRKKFIGIDKAKKGSFKQFINGREIRVKMDRTVVYKDTGEPV